ncbi:Methyltransferase domain-containing protein [Allochromatium warmingii]|uniref:Methyltransferase domain-containing protein n=2 Tax=Allochromatium warmingii TaxID=61595 RepID=A0A1H3FEN8_ALLWA|nr:Methyltransferase domain-containing protein [Allochromatium warmingii]
MGAFAAQTRGGGALIVATMTSDYYETHAATFFAETCAVDMEPLYRRFLPYVCPAGHLLDAGCGSGRDARAFRERGYTVTACDASPTLAALAATYIGIPVAVCRLQDVAWSETFDGIWACASLLHVPQLELAAVMQRLARALKPAGVLYVSFKYGVGEREQNGRRFTDLDEAGLTALVDRITGLELQEIWITADRRPERASEQWLNARLYQC